MRINDEDGVRVDGHVPSCEPTIAIVSWYCVLWANPCRIANFS